MAMELSWALKIIALFCIVWPFLAMASVPRRGRSSAPIAAGLVVLAVILCGIWLELSNAGGASMSDAVTTGSALAVWPLGWILILSLVLRHRPAVDLVVMVLGALLCLSVVIAWIFATLFTPHVVSVLFARVGAAVTLMIAIAAAVWLFLKADAALLREGA